MKAILTSNANGERIAAHLTTDHPIAFGKDKWIDAYGKETTYDGNEVWVDEQGNALCRRGEEAPAFAVERVHEYVVRAENGPKHYEGESAIEAVRTALWLMDGKDAVNAVVTCDGITVDCCQLFGLLSTQETVGENIKVIRTASHMSQMQLAKKTGLRQATIADIETGKSDCRISTLQTIAVALDCNIADLFE